MAKVYYSIEDFLNDKENQILIDKGDEESWEYLYSNNHIPKGFTDLLLKAGIDPAKIMGKIPYGYLNESSILSYNIPNNVTIIQNYAFSGCENMTNIVIPNNIIYLGQCIFEDRTSLKNIDMRCKISNIPYGTFKNCVLLNHIKIPGGVVEIGNSAFWGCGLVDITIPESVIKIGAKAFEYCNKLDAINYLGTMNQWFKIEKGKNWNSYSTLKNIVCIDGKLKI